MSLSVKTGQAVMTSKKAPARLWYNSDRSKIVPDGHVDSAFLFCAEGDHLTEDQVAELKEKSKKGSKPQGDKSQKPKGKK